MQRQPQAIVTAILLMLSVCSTVQAAGPQPFQWNGSGPFATGLGNRIITALAVSPDGRTVYAGTGSGTVFTYASPPPAVTTGAASEISATGATLSGTIGNSGADTTLTFDYGFTSGYGNSVFGGMVFAGNSGALSPKLTGLACGTTYHFRAVGTSSGGTASGQDQTFTTSACPMSGACGSSNGGTFTALPATNLCASGNPSAVSGSGPWSWSCAGTSGGTNASCTAAIDITGPAITVSTLPDGAATDNATLNVAGTVADVSGVAELLINNAAATLANGGFSHAVTLVNGVNTIRIVATDILGNSTTTTRTVTLDQAAPLLTVSAPVDNGKTAQQLLTVSGTVDETATVNVSLNNGTAQSAALTGNSFSQTVGLAAGINSVTIVATDLAGNTNTAVRSVTYDNSAPSLAITSPGQDVTTAQNSITLSGTVSDTISTATVTLSFDNRSYTPVIADGAFSQQLIMPAEGTYPVIATATDEVGNSSRVVRNLIYALPAGAVCGSAHGTTVMTTPTTNLCLTGTASAVSGSGPWRWICSGVNGGSNSSCIAIPPLSGVLDPASGKTGPGIADAMRLLNIAVGKLAPTADDYAQGDIAPLGSTGKPQGNGVIDTYDVIGMLRMVIGLL